MTSRPVDPTSDRPIFRQIADHLRVDITAGRLKAGERLPSEQRLMEEYGAARGTVREAIGVLKAEGLVQVVHGRGSFVRRRPQVRRLAHDRFARRHREAGKAAFSAEAETSGFTPSVEVLAVGRERAPADVAQRLNLRRGAPVLVRRRRYFADGEPVELAASYLPWALAKGTPIAEVDTGPGGIYARLEESGHRLGLFTEEVTARVPTSEEARALRLTEGTPLFSLVRTAYEATGDPVEVCDTVMAADRFVLAYELPAG